METYVYGDPKAEAVLLQMIDARDGGQIEQEVALISRMTGTDFSLIAVKVEDWNAQLSPWRAPSVFDGADFAGEAPETLSAVLALCGDSSKRYYIGGYSLAGLFALWAAYQTDRFAGVAAASPSVWFLQFDDYIKTHRIRTDRVYLSLGDREEFTAHPLMRTVGERIRETHEVLLAGGAVSELEWNPGNHFRNVPMRTAKAFAWLLG